MLIEPLPYHLFLVGKRVLSRMSTASHLHPSALTWACRHGHCHALQPLFILERAILALFDRWPLLPLYQVR